MGVMGNDDVDIYRAVLDQLVCRRQAGCGTGVEYDPYQDLEVDTTILALVKDGEPAARSGHRRPGGSVPAAHLLLCGSRWTGI
jgi:hypothetical protein